MSEAVERWTRLHAETEGERAGPAWLHDLRREAISAFEAQGLPSRKLEDWRYTSLKGLEQMEPRVATADPATVDLTALSLPAQSEGGHRLVFVDGRFAAELSSPETNAAGLKVLSLSGILAAAEIPLAALGARIEIKRDAFAALNTAFLEDGALVVVAPGHHAEGTIHLVFASTGGGTAAHPRLLLRIGRGASATVVQDHVSLDGSPAFSNAVSEVRLEENAQLELVNIHRLNSRSRQISRLQIDQEGNSRLACHTLCLGGELLRNDLGVTLAGQGAETTLRGLFVGNESDHVDNHTVVDHAMPHCTSDQVYKGILGGSAHGVFSGRVIVRPDAQKTSAVQSNPNLLLTDRAEIDTKPQLEIHADDVKCSHGSTVGRLDGDAVFYLRSRGLSHSDARLLLTRAFASEVTERVAAVDIAEFASRLVEARLDEFIDRLPGAGA